jgi:hypothetical protein
MSRLAFPVPLAQAEIKTRPALQWIGRGPGLNRQRDHAEYAQRGGSQELRKNPGRPGQWNVTGQPGRETQAGSPGTERTRWPAFCVHGRPGGEERKTTVREVISHGLPTGRLPERSQVPMRGAGQGRQRDMPEVRRTRTVDPPQDPARIR